nr:MAG TPA: hypothetical protein [Caudoviricetes sp.]
MRFFAFLVMFLNLLAPIQLLLLQNLSLPEHSIF